MQTWAERNTLYYYYYYYCYSIIIIIIIIIIIRQRCLWQKTIYVILVCTAQFKKLLCKYIDRI